MHHLQALQHENVVRYMHSWLEPFQPSPFCPMVPSLFILMQLADGGNLHSRLGLDMPGRQRPHATEPDIWQDMLDVTSGLAYLHEMGIIHRDLKPENILIQSSDTVLSQQRAAAGGGDGGASGHQHKTRGHQWPTSGAAAEGSNDAEAGASRRTHRLIISDLGQSQRLNSATDSRRTGCTGTVRFTAPEMLEEVSKDGLVAGGGFSVRRQFVKPDWTYAADVWSLGAIFFCLCFSAMPYEDTEDPEELAEMIVGGGPVPRPANHPQRSRQLCQMVDVTLLHDASARPTPSALLAAPMLQHALRMRRVNDPHHDDPASDHASRLAASAGARASVTRMPSELDLASKVSAHVCSGPGCVWMHGVSCIVCVSVRAQKARARARDVLTVA